MQIMWTRGFLSEVPEEIQAKIMAYGLRNIKPDKPNWVVFHPPDRPPKNCKLCEAGQPHLEDEGRTLVVPNFTGLTKKVYAILDDFGTVDALRENMGRYAPPNLSSPYVVTFLLAEEY